MCHYIDGEPHRKGASHRLTRHEFDLLSFRPDAA
jgi:hypothetical protein